MINLPRPTTCLRKSFAIAIAAVAGLLFMTAVPAQAATYYWGASGTAAYSGANWTTDTTGLTGLTSLSGSTDSIYFNGSSVPGPTYFTLSSGTSVAGLIFDNASTVTGTNNSGSNNLVLTLGSGGLLIKSGSISIGNSTNLTGISFTLGADQTWTNNSTIGWQTNNRNAINTNGFTLTFDGSGNIIQNANVNSAISGAGSLVKNGAGTLTLSSSNTFTGSTLVNSGSLVISQSNALLSSALDLSGTGKISTNGIISILETGGLKGSGSLNQANITGYNLIANLILKPSSGSVSFLGDIGEGATGMVLNKVGAGTQILSGSSSYTGITSGSAGTLQFGKTVAFYGGNTANWAPTKLTVANGATVAFNVGGSGEFSATDINSITSAFATGTSNGLLAGATIGFDTTNASGNSFLYSGTIKDSVGTGNGSVNVVKLGSNTLVLSASNAFSGAFTLNGGTVNYGNIYALGTNSIVFSGNSTLQAGTTGSFATSTVTIQAGVTGIFDTQGFNTTFSKPVGGSGVMVKIGTGTLDLSNNNPGLTAGIFVKQGTLQGDNNANAFGPSTNVVTVGDSNLGFDAALSVNQTTSNYNLGSIVLAPGSGARIIQSINHTTTGKLAATVTGTNNLVLQAITDPASILNVSGIINNIGTISTGATPFGSTVNVSGSIGSNVTNVLQNSAGTLVLSGTNLYSGTTTATAGALIAAIPLSIPSGSPVVMNGGAVGVRIGDGSTTGWTTTQADAFLAAATKTSGQFGIDLSNGDFTQWTAFTPTNFGTLGLYKSGTNTLTLNLANTYTGATVVGSGTLTIATGGSLGSSGTYSGAITTGGVFNYASSGNQTLSGAISGAGALLMNGAGALTLSGSNGAVPISINSGTLIYGSAYALGSGTTTFGANGTLQAAASGTTSLINFGTVTATIDTQGFALAMPNALVGTTSGSLIKLGSGSLFITNNNGGWTGGLFIKQGTVSTSANTTVLGTGTTTIGDATLGADATLSSGLTAAIQITNPIVIASGAGLRTIQQTTAQGTGNKVTSLISGTHDLILQAVGSAAAPALWLTGTVNTIGNLTTGTTSAGGRVIIDGQIGANVVNVTQNGAGSLFLSGTNLYTGTTTATAGALIAGIPLSIPSGSPVVINGGAVGVRIGDGSATGWTPTQADAFLAAATKTSGQFGIDTTTGDLTQWTAFTPTNLGSLGLYKSGTGTLFLTLANTYTGATVIGSGTLTIASGGSLGTSGLYAGAISTAGVLNYADGGSQTFSGVVSGTGGLAVSGGGALTLSGSNTFTGAATASSGTLILTNANAVQAGTAALSGTGAITFGSGIGTFNLGSLSGTSGLALSLTDSAAANVTLNIGSTGLSGTYTGIVSGGGAIVKSGAGTLVIGNTNNTFSGGVTVLSGTLLASNANINSVYGSGQFTLGDTSGTSNASMQIGQTTWSNAILSRAGSSGTNMFTLNGTASVVVNGTVQLDKDLVMNTFNSGGRYTFNNTISGNGGLTKIGSGTTAVIVTATNTYSGPTTIASGIFQIGNGGASGALNPASSIANSGTLIFNRNNTVTQGTDFSSVISGTGGVIQAGSGLLVFNGANTYTGATQVNAGTLQSASNGVLSTTSGITVNNAGSTLAVNMGGAAEYTSSQLTTLLGKTTFGAGTTLAVDTTSGNASIASFSGLESLAKQGENTLTLSGSNNYGGDTILNGGVLKLGAAFATSSNGLAVNTGTLDLNGFNASTNLLTSATTGFIDNTGTTAVTVTVNSSGTSTVNNAQSTGSALSFVKNGTGMLIFSQGQSFSGGITLNSGTLKGAGNTATQGVFGTGPLTLNGGSVWLSRNIVNETYGNNVTVNTDMGFLIDKVTGINSNQTQSFGSLNIGANTLTVTPGVTGTVAGITASLGFTGTTTLSGITTFTGTTNSFGAIGGFKLADVTNGGFTPIFSGGASSVTGVISGTGGLSLTGLNSSLALSGSNTYTGLTSITSGTLSVNDGAIGSSSGISNNGGLVYNLNTYSRNFVNTISGTGSLTKTGTNMLTLSGSNSLSGAVNVSQGTLNYGNLYALGSGALKLSGISTVQAGLSGTIASALNVLSGANATFDTGGFTATAISGITLTGTLTKVGTGTLIFGNANTGSGTYLIKEGTLANFNSRNNAFGVGAKMILGDSVVGANATLSMANGANTYGINSIVLATGAGTRTIQSTVAEAVGNPFSAPISGTNDLILQAVTGAGATVYSTGAISNIGAISTGATLAGNTVNIFGLISNATAVNQNSAGTLVLGGTNTYTGPTTISSGTLVAASADVSGNGALGNGGDIKFTGGALQYNTASASTDYSARIKNSTNFITLDTHSNDVTLAGSIDSTNTGGLIKTGSGTLTLTGANAYGGNTSVNSGTLTLAHVGGGTILDSGTLTANGATLNIATDNTIARLALGGTSANVMGAGILTVTGTIQPNIVLGLTSSISASLAGPGTLYKTGRGVTVLSGANSYSGGTIIAGGTLAISGAGTLGDTSGSLDLQFLNNVPVLDLGATSQTVGAVTLTSGVIQNGTLTGSSYSALDGTVTAALAGSGAFTKSGTGTVTLAGVNTYSGPTTVAAGTLVVSGSLSASSAVTVGDLANPATSAVLAGTGLVGDVTLGAADGNVGAKINPSNDVAESNSVAGARLSTGNFTMATSGSATLALQIGRTTAGATNADDTSDRLLVTGNISLGSTGNLALTLQTGYASTVGDVLYLIVSGNTGSISGSFATVNGIALTGAGNDQFSMDGYDTWRIIYGASAADGTIIGGNDVAVQLMAVPEPATWAMLVSGMGMLVFTQRIRRRTR